MSSQQKNMFTSSNERLRSNEHLSQSRSTTNNQRQMQLTTHQLQSPFELQIINREEFQCKQTPGIYFINNERIRNLGQRYDPQRSLLNSNRSRISQQNSPYSPFTSPEDAKNKKRDSSQYQAYFGYEEYEYTNQDKKEYTTIYYFKFFDKKNPNNDYFHEIVTQACLKKFYFSVMLKKLIGFLEQQNSNRYCDVFCNQVYYDRLIQVIDPNYQPQTPQQKRSFENLEQTKQKYLNSKLKFTIRKISQDEISSTYLDQKDFPCQQFSSIRIPNQYSCHESEEFLRTEEFNHYLDKDLKDLFNIKSKQKIKNEFIEFNGPKYEEEENEILPYYHSPVHRDNSRSRSRSPLKCVRYD
ncbi:hypothetical protein TTHERM_00125120 (macronuclear) [Tetrahymena thermophila SB210]|uniref:Uncharacterized protein n=1 Tax=Tetrahymena thermophila (strain SB210) TaxID=312017 RepID=I7M7T2_TETTS|nr:hypothetical protein TTHERM_00125120 [Tetrahymena thermophila SB210]EAR95946.2 hypothetical protein TTHERM_00125120 [Tetrahymena thermophila SB210]|eukprot:XP_001016191.2 hypothetical protein TTHERM_00125120 [Tetrahymena thermophila SB210]